MEYLEENLISLNDIESLINQETFGTIENWETIWNNSNSQSEYDSQEFEDSEDENLDPSLEQGLTSDLYNSNISEKKSKSDLKTSTQQAKSVVETNNKIAFDNFVKNNYHIVKPLADKYNIPVHFVLAIMGIESRHGRSRAFREFNVGFNMKGNKNGGIKLTDKDMSGKQYVASYNVYNSLSESIEDFLKWCKSKNITGNSDEDLADAFAWSGWAEGIGKTKTEAKSKLKKNYIDMMVSVKSRINKFKL